MVMRLSRPCFSLTLLLAEISDAENEIDDRDDAVEYRPVPKLVNKKCQSIARWNAEQGRAEVVVRKGTWWNYMGIMLGPNLLCNVEEAVFLAEIGSLVLTNGEQCMSVHDMYMLLATGVYGCSWDEYQIYLYLKNLGYVVKRHGVEWTSRKDTTIQSASAGGGNGSSNDNEVGQEASPVTSTDMDNRVASLSLEVEDRDLQMDNISRIMFDVYPPNKNFKKTRPGSPLFCLCALRGDCLPTRIQIKDIKEQLGGIPLKFGCVEGGHVSIFSFDEVNLPYLP